jgi:hypothetical protein
VSVERCDMAYWWPHLQRCATFTGVRLPRTTLVRAAGSVAETIYNRPCAHFDPLVADLQKAAEEFGYPCFLRTGHGSGKHEWQRTCHVPDAASMAAHVLALIEWSECVDMFGLPTETWVVREMLPLVTSFVAFHGRMPINKERRYFFDDGPGATSAPRVVCHHPYWPEAAVADGLPETADWKKSLAQLNEETPEEIALLTAMTERLVATFDHGAWCIDWAQAVDGTWYPIDMAEARRAFHWKGCPEAKRFRPNEPEERDRAPPDFDALLVKTS